jgi:RNA polymerase sigma-70 factor (ECF subfamily)
MVAYELLDESSLLQAFKKGEMGAFEVIYKRHWYKLYCIAFKQTSSQHESEEMVQALFERIWKNRETAVIKSLEPYLVISLRNMIVDYFRQKASERKLKQTFEFQEAANLTEEEINRTLLLNKIENILQELPEKTQTVFKMSRYEHKSVKEIAEYMQLTEKAVEYHITKAIKLLRQYLKHYLSVFLNF